MTRCPGILALALLHSALDVHGANVALQLVASGLSDPTSIVSARDASGRLFMTLLDGRVMVHDGCQLLATPFLDIRSLVLSGGERGLLSLAFHPSFPATPYFYVNYTREPDGATVIARYRVSMANPNRADAGSAVSLLVIPQPFDNHNGGQLQFGPDDYLYIGMGDGGSGGDPACYAQRNDTLLGKMLRIDVNQNFNAPPYYGIPPGNPMTVGPPEVWAKGLRNPWRFSFDRATGDLFISDVGQDSREEIDRHAAGSPSGQNYGWKMMEGSLCRGDSSGCPESVPACNHPSLVLPILEYGHAAGRCAVTGGYRYRGTQIPDLAGAYVYADYCTGEIFAATENAGVWTSSLLLSTGFNVTSFGEDEAGELYVTDFRNAGGVHRIVAASAQANLSITKSDGVTSVLAGEGLSYTIGVGNSGPSSPVTATVTDLFPAALTGVQWSCSASAGSSCCSAANGTGNINRPVSVASGGTLTITATATLIASATGTLSNTATVSSPLMDPVPGNNGATDTDTIVPIANLSITKTNGQTTASPSTPVTYTIVASNAGPNAAMGATVTDTVPAALTGVSWTCVGAGGGTCTANGSGNINDTVNLPVGASVTYTLSGMVAGSPSGLINTASVSVPAGMADPNLSNNSATDEDLLLCFGERVVVPDGRVTEDVIGASATTWFLSRLKSGSSYSLKFKNSTGESTVPGTLTVFSGADGCRGTSTLTVRDTSTMEPAGGAGLRRVSFTARSPGSYFRARLVNGMGAPIGYSFSWSETTLFSATWSTNGSFNTFYSFQNTTGASVSGTLTLLDTAGVVVQSFPVTVPVGRTTSVNTQGLGVVRNKVGTARFSHDGPPGAVLAEAAIANFTISPAYVQPVRFQAVREAR